MHFAQARGKSLAEHNGVPGAYDTGVCAICPNRLTVERILISEFGPLCEARLERTGDIDMKEKLTKDLMIPLEEYAVVHENDTVLEALSKLQSAQKRVPPGRQPHRAILVSNDEGEIIGKIGHLAFLKALEPKYAALGDLGVLSRAGITDEFITSIKDQIGFFSNGLATRCLRVGTVKAGDIMHPVKEHIDESSSLSEAIHKVIMWQTLSVLVTRGKRVIGLIRLSDLFQEITEEILEVTMERSH